MKYLCSFISAFIFFISTFANALVINDVRSINSVVHGGELIREEFKLTDYGFVTGRDSMSSIPIITIELRDTEYRPDKEYWEQPFVMIVLSLGRHHARVGIEDWIEHWVFDEEGLLPVSVIVVDPPDVWVGNITLSFEFTPGPSTVSESAPFILISIGFLALALARYRYFL